MGNIIKSLVMTVLVLGAAPAGFAVAYGVDVLRPDLKSKPVAQAPTSVLFAPREEVIPIGEVFPGLEAGRATLFRARKLILQPGAETELLRHEGRPGITFVAYGEVVERREGQAPTTRKAGDYTLDKVTVAHSWANTGTEPAVLLIADLVSSGGPDAAAEPAR